MSRFFHRQKQRYAVLWAANVFAALIFVAAHISGAMMLLQVSSLNAIPLPAMGELILLNGVVGLVAGDCYINDGLIAAIGVHFWADMVWHVIYPTIF